WYRMPIPDNWWIVVFSFLDFWPKLGTQRKELLIISIIHSCLERYLVRFKIIKNFTRFQGPLKIKSITSEKYRRNDSVLFHILWSTGTTNRIFHRSPDRL